MWVLCRCDGRGVRRLERKKPVCMHVRLSLACVCLCACVHATRTWTHPHAYTQRPHSLAAHMLYTCTHSTAGDCEPPAAASPSTSRLPPPPPRRPPRHSPLPPADPQSSAATICPQHAHAAAAASSAHWRVPRRGSQHARMYPASHGPAQRRWSERQHRYLVASC